MFSRMHLYGRWCAIAVVAMARATAVGGGSIPAFPGAEGPGSSATGGRGGEVYHVTNLDDSGPGSLRDALSCDNRVIVFDVGGIIRLAPGSWLRSGSSNLTIAGQTAPGTGITIIGQGVKLTGDNVIVRNIRIRPGKDQKSPGAATNDGLWLQTRNSIVDHVSVSWADDEGISATDAAVNTTVQYCIIAEGLNYRGHAYGSMIASEHSGALLSFHHNLYAHHKSRLPRLGSEKGEGAIANFSNNIVYNWINRAGYSALNREKRTEEPSRTNFLGNYYIAGPDTQGNATTFFGAGPQTRIYQRGNKRDMKWSDRQLDGTDDGWDFFSGSFTRHQTAFDVPGGFVQSADDALRQVLRCAGATWWARDPVDARVVADVLALTGRIINEIDEIGGWPVYPTESRPADFDTDRDGMPDAWELAHGLNPRADDRNDDFDSDGYTNIEEYLNELAAFAAPKVLGFTTEGGRYELCGNWDLNWQPSRYDTLQINSGAAKVDSVGQHAGVLKVAADANSIAQLEITAGRLDVAEKLVIAEAAGASGTVVLRGGTLRAPLLTGGAGNASFRFTGGVLHAGEVTFDLVNEGGTLAPGDGIGQTHARGNLTLKDGAVQIELASGSSFDTIIVDGQLTLGGRLEIILVDGYQPPAQQRFEIIKAGRIIGSFERVVGAFKIEQTADCVYLVAAP